MEDVRGDHDDGSALDALAGERVGPERDAADGCDRRVEAHGLVDDGSRHDKPFAEAFDQSPRLVLRFIRDPLPPVGRLGDQEVPCELLAANSIPAGLAEAAPARSGGAGASESIAAWRADIFPADKVHDAIMRARVAALATDAPELGVGPIERGVCIDRPRPGDRRRHGNRFCWAHRGLGCSRGGQQTGQGGREAA